MGQRSLAHSAGVEVRGVLGFRGLGSSLGSLLASMEADMVTFSEDGSLCRYLSGLSCHSSEGGV